MPSRSKIRRIWRTGFYIYGWTVVRTVALRWVIFKQKKGSATICLGLIYCFMGLSQPPTRDTVPLKANSVLITKYVTTDLQKNGQKTALFTTGPWCESFANWLCLQLSHQITCNDFFLTFCWFTTLISSTGSAVHRHYISRLSMKDPKHLYCFCDANIALFV
jgi:hypothetical protein